MEIPQQQTEEGQLIIEPMAGRVAVEFIDAPDKVGMLYLPETAQGERGTCGRVIATCADYSKDGQEYEPLFKVGDVLVFGKYTGTTVTVNRHKVIILREVDVLCRVHSAQPIDPRAIEVLARD